MIVLMIIKKMTTVTIMMITIITAILTMIIRITITIIRITITIIRRKTTILVLIILIRIAITERTAITIQISELMMLIIWECYFSGEHITI